MFKVVIASCVLFIAASVSAQSYYVVPTPYYVPAPVVIEPVPVFVQPPVFVPQTYVVPQPVYYDRYKVKVKSYRNSGFFGRLFW